MEGKHQGPLPNFFIMEPSSFKVKSATGSTLTSIYYTSCEDTLCLDFSEFGNYTSKGFKKEVGST